MTLIEEFVSQWQNEDAVTGILLTGSYALEMQTELSDIDFRIIMSEAYNNPKKITEVVEGKTFSYMIGNSAFYEAMLQQQYHFNIKTEARTFYIGTIQYEKDKALSSLKNRAQEYLERPFLPLKSEAYDKLVYELYTLEEKYLKKEVHFKKVAYYLDLKRIFDIYSELLNNEKIIDIGKLNTILEDANYRSIYHYNLHIDSKFIRMWKEFENAETINFSKNIQTLIVYIRTELKMETTQEFIINPY